MTAAVLESRPPCHRPLDFDQRPASGPPTPTAPPGLADALATDRRGEFLAMILHELRSPLASIVAGVTFARDLDDAGSKPEWLWNGIEKAARQAESLLADLMGLCQTTHPTFRLQRRRINIWAVARAVIERYQNEIEQKGLALHEPYDQQCIWVVADSERLEVALGNLLENAIKYTAAGGTITVRIEQSGTDALVQIQDTGIGIAAEILPFVFEPFVREQFVGASSQRGSGIGLLLVKTIMELHGGSVQARSAGRGRGSEFLVRLGVADHSTSNRCLSEESQSLDTLSQRAASEPT